MQKHHVNSVSVSADTFFGMIKNSNNMMVMIMFVKRFTGQSTVIFYVIINSYDKVVRRESIEEGLSKNKQH